MLVFRGYPLEIIQLQFQTVGAGHLELGRRDSKQLTKSCFLVRRN